MRKKKSLFSFVLIIIIILNASPIWSQCSDVPVKDAVVNGDFEKGYLNNGSTYLSSGSAVDFQSDLTYAGNYSAPSGCLYSIGNKYGVGKADSGIYNCAARYDEPYLGTGYINVPFTDHTPGKNGKGYAMIADFESFGSAKYDPGCASPSRSSLPSVWRQTVNIQAGEKYYFSAWFANYNRDAGTGGYQYATLSFVVVPVVAGTPQWCSASVVGSASPNQPQMTWQQFYGVWTPGASYTQALLLIEVDAPTLTNANDFAIDDISFINGCSNLTGSLPSSLIPDLGSDTSICLTSGSLILNSNVSIDGVTQFYWYSGSSSPQTTLSYTGANTNLTQNTYTISAIGTYRVCVQNGTFPSGCSASSTITVTNTMPSVTLADQSVCTSSSVTLAPNITSTDVTYSWVTRPSGVSDPGTRTLTTSVKGSYAVKVTPSAGAVAAGCSPVTSNTANVTVDISTPSGTASCSGSTKSFTLTATGGDGSGYSWWDAASGGNYLGSGTPLTITYTSPATPPSIVYVENYYKVIAKTDAAKLTSADGGGYTTDIVPFTVSQDFTLVSADINIAFCSSSSSSYSVSLFQNGSLVAGTTKSFSSCAIGALTVPLNFYIAAGSGYELRTSGSGVWFNDNGGSTSSNTSNSYITVSQNSSSSWGGFSNLVIKPGTGCMRTPLAINCSLPIRFVSVYADQTVDGIKINWISEETGSYKSYFVERMTNDDHGFKQIGTVAASHSSLYSFIDNNQEKNVTYYRVGIQDENGLVIYSEIVSVSIDINSELIHVYPNPFLGSVTIQNLNGNETSIQITDITGQLIEQMEFGVEDKFNIGDSWPKGTYLVHVLDKFGRSKVLKLIKLN